jgi:hypothetical protein
MKVATSRYFNRSMALVASAAISACSALFAASSPGFDSFDLFAELFVSQRQLALRLSIIGRRLGCYLECRPW